MASAGTGPWTALTVLKLVLRFLPPLLGLFVIGRAVVLSIGGDIERWQFALGALLILAGFTSKLVPRR
ncbi:MULTISPECIES: hypothetical protein [unclassified Methylobacterium]|uniref:hypothetical protein n=1 Tax=unclassified Methylobacterium TaxID=2615210 RepID=UPI001FBA1C66|nr:MULTISPECIES: hypothetical protein [unclassified Methylobacterium]MCJ2093786.1 hypothetical protein [Methylobacterium sp. J-072]MCJ2144370.1 hypothetical protein [Methylobacterium sp. E-066]